MKEFEEFESEMQHRNKNERSILHSKKKEFSKLASPNWFVFRLELPSFENFSHSIYSSKYPNLKRKYFRMFHFICVPFFECLTFGTNSNKFKLMNFMYIYIYT